MSARNGQRVQILLSEEEKELLEVAREDCRLRIRHDQTISSPRIRRFLVYLQHHLYSEDLSVARWKAACNIRSNSFGGEFKKDLNSTPYAYLTERRLETAARLLLEPAPAVWKIAHLVGYADPAVFSRAFQVWADIRPAHFREAEMSKNRSPRQDADTRRPVMGWRSAIEGTADSDDLLARRKFVERPHISQTVCPQIQTTGNTRDKRRAERIWGSIRNRSFLEQVTLIQLQGEFETTALFDLLRKKSRVEGRRDRQRGIAIAELALHSLSGCAAALGKDIHNREAQGWINLGVVRRLALDFIGAEQEFCIGESIWQAANVPNPLVEAELCAARAALQWFQMSCEKAHVLIERAVDILRNLNHPESLAESIILRGSIKRYLGSHEETILDFGEALQILNRKSNPYLVCAAYSGLTISYLSLNDIECAQESALEVQSFAQEADLEIVTSHSWWLNGLVKKAMGDRGEAELHLRNAIGVFQKLHQPQNVCGILIELATLYAESGRNQEALKAVSEAITIVDLLKVNKDALAALRLLKSAVEKREVSLEVLRRVNSLLEKLLQHPLTGLRLRMNKKAG